MEPINLDNYVPVMPRPAVRPFSPAIAKRLGEYNRLVQAALDARQAYIRGVLDVLGVDEASNVSVDLDAFTYAVSE